MMIKPHKIWLGLAPRPSKNNPRSQPAVRKRIQFRILMRLLHGSFPEIYAGVIGASWTKQEAEDFCDVLRKDAPGHIYKQRRNLLVQGLERGAGQLGWQVYIPAPVTYATREPPHFTGDAMRGLGKLRAFESLFLQSLDRPLTDGSSILLGYLAFSASVYGGLLSRQWLIAWLRDPFEGLVFEEDIAWVEIYRPVYFNKEHSGECISLHKRWFIDPLTLLILGRIRLSIQIGSNRLRVDPWQYLTQLMDHLQLDINHRQKNLSDFLAMAHTRISLYSKPYLADYAIEKIKSVSLPADVWARVRVGHAVPIELRALSLDSDFIPKEKSKNIKQAVTDMPPALWAKLYEAIHPKECRARKEGGSSASSKTAVQIFLELHGSKMSQLGWLIAQWAIMLFTYKRGIRKGSKIAPSSVRTYVTTIARKLQVHVGGSDIMALNECEFYALYRDVIESKCGENNKQVTAMRLAEFHDFLVYYWDVPKIDLTEFYRGKGSSDLGVDANIVCPSIYQYAANTLGKRYGARAPRDNLIALLIMMLGFRCGLRRAEVMTILCSDICGLYNPVLFIRHNPYAYKKSDSAVRKIHLKAFLTHNELTRLKEWIHLRGHEDGIEYQTQWEKKNQKRLLFCKAGTPFEPIDERQIFGAIHQALRQVSADPSLHFHTLRHSFASWFFYRLESGSQTSWRPKSVSALNESMNSMRRCLVEHHHLQIDLRINRKALYHVALVCGHSSPEMSLRHYIHLLDLLLGCSTMRNVAQPILTLEAVLNLTDIKKAMAYRLRQKAGMDQWLPSAFIAPAWKQLKHQFKDPRLNQLSAVNISDIIIEPLPIEWRTVQSILEDRSVKRMAVSDISAKYTIEEQKLKHWFSRANELFGMRTRKTKAHPNGKPRHRVTALLPFPTGLTSPYDIEMADRIFSFTQKRVPQKRELIHQWLNHFIHHYSPKGGDIRFTDEANAIEYLQFLTMIGVRKEEMKLLHYRGKGRSAEEAKLQADQWANALSIPVDQCDLIKATFGQQRGNGTIGITISSITGVSGVRKKRKAKLSMPYGFRYALYILYILDDAHHSEVKGLK
ncbi:tyrosine-type recombinase/integrase [Mariprofundus ferrooxydans]|uniref:Tyr recombinase domain-containing protein n=1 Tax=Mariprofundus ferrooxydans PV-1 TaxID=314345 RepID=Q0F1I2_9PROT|nr:tyrosine-type recombinase/integrase [Mariprofundus ferrooxydans]EAU55209.1 hypothetical protein SPV1_10771 [Mariprofundus ferrooxydans PV-1]